MTPSGFTHPGDAAWRHRFVWAFAAIWAALAIAPTYRADWALENVLVAAGALLLFGLRHRAPLPAGAALMVFLFGCLHAVGAHYTYSEVPYDRWFEAVAGTSLDDILGFERNQFDRLVHLLFGLLLTWPLRRIAICLSGIRGAWSHAVAVMLVVTAGSVYEILEWLAADALAPELGMAYVGAQGDLWDAQKDMALALAGALTATVLAVARDKSRAGRGSGAAPGR